MFSRGSFFWPTNLLLASAFLFYAHIASAQHHGGHAGPGGIPGGASRPDGVDEKDTLKDFHEALAVQATDEQAAEFRALAKSTEDAKSRLATLEQGHNASPVSEGGAQLSHALDSVLTGSKRFVDGFSAAQKSGLKELLKRLAKADFDLEAEEKRLDQSLQPGTSPIPAHAETLDKALTDFSNQQLALGREMGIILASEDDVTFNFAPVKSTAKIGNQTTAVNIAGAISQTAAQNGQRTFKLEMVADLLDLQQNITQFLRPEIEKASGCGERLALRQASIAPSAPSSTLILQLHYERWSCRGSISSEIAEGDGSVDIKLTPAVQKSNSLTLAAEFSRIDASGMMSDSLRSGDLGDELRDRVSQSLLAAMQAGADFRTTLPPAVQSSAVVQSVKFRDATAGRLTVVFDGKMEVSNDQVKLMASQMNQSSPAQGTASR